MVKDTIERILEAALIHFCDRDHDREAEAMEKPDRFITHFPEALCSRAFEQGEDNMVKTNVRTDGFEGILLPGNGSKEKVLIVMSGSNGGMRLTRQCAEFYDRNGIPALALALFATKGTQPYLDRVPVEYVERAIRWLREQGYEKIGIDGMSKGSELALTAAAMFGELSCVIARVPSHFVSEGLVGSGSGKGPSGTSCWSYQGIELPFASYTCRDFNLLKMLREERELHMISFNAGKEVHEDSLIPIEKIRAPILMLSSKNDSVWPSYESAVYMEKRLAQCSFPYPVRHVAFENMSHALLTSLPLLYGLGFKAERDHIVECRKERELLKKELLEWVNHVW